MKNVPSIISSTAALLLCSTLATQAQMAMPKAKATAKPLNVALLVYPEVEALDVSGALDVFVKTNDVAPRSFNVFTVAKSRAPFKTQGAVLTLTPRYDLATCPRPDIIVVPGASMERVSQLGQDARVRQWLRANSKPGQTIMSVCTGAFIVAGAGLLDNKNSTTHWFVQSDFQRQFPKTKAYSGVRFVRDGNVLSTAGVSSGIDGALQIVEDVKGKSTADLVARVIQYRRGTPSYPEQPRARVRLKSASVATNKNQKLALDYDPICHMKVGPNTSNTFAYKGKIYGFCSPGCRDAFATHPEQFLKSN